MLGVGQLLGASPPQPPCSKAILLSQQHCLQTPPQLLHVQQARQRATIWWFYLWLLLAGFRPLTCTEHWNHTGHASMLPAQQQQQAQGEITCQQQGLRFVSGITLQAWLACHF
jgi:predicted nucleic acid-binding Zn ribbon protein